jgi:pimeloyl-ACP methyl ester carboxylesterase
VKPRFVSSGAHQLRLWSAGEGSPVVVLPGLVQAASVVAARLAGIARELSFFVFDLPGMGCSADAACASLDEVIAMVQGAIDAAGLKGAPVLAFDLAAPIAQGLAGPKLFLGAGQARAWAARKPNLGDLSPRADGTHLTALFAHLRDCHVLDARTGRRASREGEPLPTPAELDAALVSAGAKPQSYASLWSMCCDGMSTVEGDGAAGIDAALAQLTEMLRTMPRFEPSPASSSTQGPVISRSYVETPRGRVHLRMSGPDMSPLIALHSAPGSSAPLTPLLTGLGKGRRVIAPDFIGNGDSGKIDAPVDIATLARDALSVADALGLQRFDLWGTHTGALIAMEAAIIAPERVGRVILEAPPLLAPAFTVDLLANYFPPLVPDGWGLYLQHAWNMRRDMFLFWPWYRAERDAARPLDVPDAAFLHDWTIGLLASGATYHRSYRAAFEYDTRARMPLLTRPAFVCAGPADMLADGLQAARALLGADAVVSPTPATVWYPGQGADAIEKTIAMYERFLET